MLVVLVACIMISTLNLITIRERYDEVAVRRCEGARKADLAAQVTAEGLVTSVAGGLLGLPLGYAGAEALKRIVDFPFRFEPRYAAAAILVSAALGLLSSVVPARRAAGLDPARVLSRRLT
jgi:putative ABC transport system permease protein